jgi:hypothetical protein
MLNSRSAKATGKKKTDFLPAHTSVAFKLLIMQNLNTATIPDITSFLIKNKIKGFVLSKKSIKEPGKYQIDTYTLLGLIPIYRSIIVFTEPVPD